MTDLSPFEDIDVVAAKIEIPDAAGGLRDAMSVEPVELHLGDEVHVVLHCRVKKVRFDPHGKPKDGVPPDTLERVHVFQTIEAAFIDSDSVEAHVRGNVDRVRKLLEEQKGVQRLDDALADDDAREEKLVADHDSGLHHGVNVEGCPACDERDEDREAEKAR